MKTPILGSAYVARSINEADNQMINLYPEIVPEGGKESAFLIKTPGLRLLATVGTGPIRGLWWHANYAYVVSGSSFYKVNTSYNATLIGTVEGTGLVSMVDNGGVIFIAAGSHSYQYNINTSELLEITDEEFLGAAVVGYLDTYFVYITPNSQLVSTVSSITPTGDFIWPLVFDATSVGSAEGAPDNLVSMAIDHNEVWLFGENSIEVWYDAGNADFPLQRIQGAFNELGCAARFSVAKMDNTIFWLGADARGRGMVYKANGYRGERVSTHAIEFSISQYGDLSNAVAYTYQQEGHSFYVLTFPNVGVTWAYDAATNAWHQRGEWLSANYGRHRGNCQLAFNNENIVGDYINGNLYALDLDVFDDNGTPIRWLRSWRALPTGANNLKRTAHHSLQLDCESGVGIPGLSVNQADFLLTDNSVSTTPYGSTNTLEFTVTAGVGTDGFGDYGYGYSINISVLGAFGSLSNGSVYGHPVAELHNDSTGSSILTLEGFASNPTSAYIYSVTCNGITVLSSSANYLWQYENATSATWIWSAANFGMVDGGTYDVSIVLVNGLSSSALYTDTYISAGSFWTDLTVGSTVSGTGIATGTTITSKNTDAFGRYYVLLSSPPTSLLNAQNITFTSGEESDIVTEDDDYLILDYQYTVGADPQVMLRWSDDGGHTWSNEHWAPMGKLGEYYKRVIWRRLGMTTKIRDRVYEVSGSDPVSVYIMGAELVISGTNA